MKVFLDIARGDAQTYQAEQAKHAALVDWLSANHASYGLPGRIDALSEAEGETVQELYEGANVGLMACPGSAWLADVVDDRVGQPGATCLLEPPAPLVIGRLVFELSDQPNLARHVENFRLLCSGESPTFQGKVLNKQGHRYAGTPIHRWVPDFVMQGGDVTRKDGSGGQSVYGSPLPDPKPPHATHSYGSLSMASGGSKNSSTSQFFVCLCGPASGEGGADDKARVEAAKKKLDGKYFPFGRLVEGADVLRLLEKEIKMNKKEQPIPPVWVEDCGVL